VPSKLLIGFLTCNYFRGKKTELLDLCHLIPAGKLMTFQQDGISLHVYKLHYFPLILDYRPIDTNLRTSLTDKSVVVSTSFDITCSSQANPPAKYRFYKDQDNFVNGTTGGDISVITTSINKRVKQVNYGCTPFNDFGDGSTKVITVTVLCKYSV